MLITGDIKKEIGYFERLEEVIKKVKENYKLNFVTDKRIRNFKIDGKNIKFKNFVIEFNTDYIKENFVKTLFTNHELYFNNFNKNFNKKDAKKFAFIISLLNSNYECDYDVMSGKITFSNDGIIYFYDIKTGKFFCNEITLCSFNEERKNYLKLFLKRKVLEETVSKNKNTFKFINALLKTKDLIYTYFYLEDEISTKRLFILDNEVFSNDYVDKKQKEDLNKIFKTNIFKMEDLNNISLFKNQKKIYCIKTKENGNNCYCFDKNANLLVKTNERINNIFSIENDIVLSTYSENIILSKNKNIDYNYIFIKNKHYKVKKIFHYMFYECSQFNDIFKIKFNNITYYGINIKNFIYIIEQKYYEKVLEKVKYRSKVKKYFLNNMNELENYQNAAIMMFNI